MTNSEKFKDVFSLYATELWAMPHEDLLNWINTEYKKSDLKSYHIKRNLMKLQNVRPNNQINLCDSCNYLHPDCPSEWDDVIFGNGRGNDNICACSKYSPSAQPKRKKGKWIPQDHNKHHGMMSTMVYYFPKCSMCGESANYTNFCPNCGSDMRGEQE